MVDFQLATKSNDFDLQSILKASSDYRNFLKNYLAVKGLKISDFARATGFSRGYPSDVLSGKRRLTQKSALKFEKALKLSSLGKKFFSLLVALEEPDLFAELDRSTLAQKILELRQKNWQTDRRKLREIESSSSEELLSDSRVMAIYAAAGEPEKGASLAQIQKRTRLYGQELERNLKKLQAAEFLRQEGEHYFPKDLHLFLETTDQSRLLKSVFQKACRLASESVQNPQSKQEMFFCSNFCIQEEKLPELKAALRELVLRYIDDAISPDGDRVVRFVTALHF